MQRYPPIPTEAASQQPGQEAAASGASASGVSASTSRRGMSLPWTVPGTMGGILFGATVAGPLGAVAGGLAGALAGVFRDVTGKPIAQAFLDAPEADKRKMLEQAGFLLLGGQAFQAAEQHRHTCSTSSAPARDDRMPVDSGSGLTAAALEELGSAPAAEGEPVCVLCMTNAVQVVFQPCGHAQVCGLCAAQVVRMAYTGACPVCRTRIQRITRVFIAGSAAPAAQPTAQPSPSLPASSIGVGQPPEPVAPSAPPAPAFAGVKH